MPKRATSPLQEYQHKRDFSQTAEPAGVLADTGERRVFVIQKHAATALHFDLRLQLGGVMKSWAVPKGPSLDPSVRRLAIEVEDHPIDYNSFEGVIPAGQYGGGTVMIWDHGTLKTGGGDRGFEQAYQRGRLDFTLDGERLRGGFKLIRTSDAEGRKKPQWLLVKEDDDAAAPGDPVTEAFLTSVVSGRSIDEIRTGAPARDESSVPQMSAAKSRTQSVAGLAPMLATNAAGPPVAGDWTFEPKYDGIRVLAFGSEDDAALITRNGRNKSPQFPAISAAVREVAAAAGGSLVLDGEIVALRDGQLARFETLQGRMHLTGASAISKAAAATPAVLVAFDALLVDGRLLVTLPWTERRAELEALLAGSGRHHLRLGHTTTDHAALLRQAEAEGWEGLLAKRTSARYRPGARSADWQKLKLEGRQEFVIGGYTEPRGSRPHFGALLLGYYDEDGDLCYAGHTGTGFSQDQLDEVFRKMQRLRRKTSPFRTIPETNMPATWVTPKLVAEIRFNEWTSAGKLRHPVFLGLREEKDPKEVRRERTGPAAASPPPQTSSAPHSSAPAGGRVPEARDDAEIGDVVAQLRRLEDSGGGTLVFPGGRSLAVTNVGKIFFPEAQITKGDLLRYYAAMAPLILPAMAGRPLVLKRFPNGIDGESFYQQAAEDVPPGIRAEPIHESDGGTREMLVGGDLATLLYTVQLGAISFDPWHSRMGRLDYADYTVIDLDPGSETPFSTVVDVARWVKDELDAFGLHGALKTSGSSGLHIYLPLPPATPLEAATLVAQIIATKVAAAHPKQATVVRQRARRPKGTVYVDYLQNLLGKTVAGVYSVRARTGATVSAPLRWAELTSALSISDFTIRSVQQRVARRGDPWHPAIESPNDLARLLPEAG